MRRRGLSQGRVGAGGLEGAPCSHGPAVRGVPRQDLPLLRLSPSSGLIIVNAWYGKFVNDKSKKSEKVKVIDVTVPLQCLVKDSKLILTEASKVQHAPTGFGQEGPLGRGHSLAPRSGRSIAAESLVLPALAVRGAAHSQVLFTLELIPSFVHAASVH